MNNQAMSSPTPHSSGYYLPPTRRFDRAFGVAVRWLVDRGISVAGARTLSVAGRKSGVLQQVPVNVLTIDGERYLVAARGNTQWVRNLRAAGAAELRIGRRREIVGAVELTMTDTRPAKSAVLRAYLRRWGWEVKQYLPEPIDGRADDAQMAAVATQLPIFRLTTPTIDA